MLVMYLGWKMLKRTKVVSLFEMDLETDTHSADTLSANGEMAKSTWRKRAYTIWRWFL